jgi:hypothetical protein
MNTRENDIVFQSFIEHDAYVSAITTTTNGHVENVMHSYELQIKIDYFTLNCSITCWKSIGINESITSDHFIVVQWNDLLTNCSSWFTLWIINCVIRINRNITRDIVMLFNRLVQVIYVDDQSIVMRKRCRRHQHARHPRTDTFVANSYAIEIWLWTISNDCQSLFAPIRYWQ